MLLRFIHHRDPANPGDMFSTPARYFDWGPSARVEVTGVRDPVPSPGETPAALIVGGGGLLGNDHYARRLEDHLATSGTLRVLWGAGHNTHLYPMGFRAHAQGPRRLLAELRGWLVRRGWRSPSTWSRRLRYEPSAADTARLKSFDLVGLRDWLPEQRWVPCASCLHPALARHRDDRPRHDLVFADHPKFFAIVACRGPKLSNLDNTVESMVAFLASGRTVVTSSYHAAYWALLLGRKVVIAPWSTKFLRFKWPVELAPDLDGLHHHRDRARSFPEAYAEARDANLSFASAVSDRLGLPPPTLRFSSS